jgi:glyoxylase-like metal-dependent hydrolase (beta-lactamase superfamily II)
MGALTRQHGVRSIDVAVPTHYHDDHLAGFQLLHDVMGTRLWIPESFHELLADPDRYGVPCLWFDPVRAETVMPLGVRIPWEEYELTLHPLPGHTQWAVAIEFQVDGLRVLATGDHQQDRWLNYTYANRFRMGDFVDSAELYQRLDPDLIISGHWPPTWVDQPYLDDLAERGRTLERLHRELLPLDEVDFEAGGLGAWIEPYVSRVTGGVGRAYAVMVRNPWRETASVKVTPALPDGWHAEPGHRATQAGPLETACLVFHVIPPAGVRLRRERIGADITWGGRRFGQLAEALVDVAPSDGPDLRRPWDAARVIP